MVASARPGSFAHVGLNTNLTGVCVDHTIHLGVEESLGRVPKMVGAINKVRKLVEYFVQSSLARQALRNIMQELGVAPLAVAQGTSNR
jgi:hypothetical protein